MGLLSQSVSITRYRVQGQLEEPVLDTIALALKRHAVLDIDNDAAEKSCGWTSFENPFAPDFEGSNHLFGSYLVFSLRVDKKSIPSKILKKHFTIEETKRLAASGRRFFSRNEKKLVKEEVLHRLSLRIPATPHIYDLIWNYEGGKLWFFSNLKAANEELETLFSESFNLSLIRMFPYTAAEIDADLSDSDRDRLNQISPVSLTGQT
ncbi:MAG: recombination-associated protein RdgC [Desulfobacterales bacterium]|nr:recombination-associated protein RdgC [Desulfobacterales bacterium]